jgi:hypothetical protein
MNAVAEASTLLRELAGPYPAGDTVKGAINRATRRVSRFLPMKAGRAEDIWRQEARAIRAEEMDAIRRAASEDRLSREAKDELAAINARISRLEALLVSDADFHRDQVDAWRQASRVPGRPVDGAAE